MFFRYTQLYSNCAACQPRRLREPQIRRVYYVLKFLRLKSLSRESRKSETIVILGVLLQNMINLSAVHADAHVSKFLPVKENGLNILWRDLTAYNNG
jgi:hypothetical protein